MARSYQPKSAGLGRAMNLNMFMTQENKQAV